MSKTKNLDMVTQTLCLFLRVHLQHVFYLYFAKTKKKKRQMTVVYTCQILEQNI